MNGWMCVVYVSLSQGSSLQYVPAWRVVHGFFEPKGILFVEVLLLAPVTPTFCPVRGNEVHANRSDELKSELHPDIPPKHTPANNWAADLVGGPGGSPSIGPLFHLAASLHSTCTALCQDARPLTGLDNFFSCHLRHLVRCSHAPRPSY